jgi:hypothetical protein
MGCFPSKQEKTDPHHVLFPTEFALTLKLPRLASERPSSMISAHEQDILDIIDSYKKRMEHRTKYSTFPRCKIMFRECIVCHEPIMEQGLKVGDVWYHSWHVKKRATSETVTNRISR